MFQDGKEYVYQSEIRVATGTMDYAPHLAGGIYRTKTRVQVSNSENTLNVEVNMVLLTFIIPLPTKDFLKKPF